jgi:exonuclease SbcC
MTMAAEVRRILGGQQAVAVELDQRAVALRQGLDADEGEIAALERAIATYESSLEALGVATDADEMEISRLADLAATRTVVLEDLKDAVIGFEMALDTAARSAASERLAGGIRSTEAEIRSLRHEQSEDEAWVRRFEALERQLERTQERAVATYTQEYGPLTSLIQRRLRPVSGFDEISLQPERDRINVRVSRSGEQLPPTDFFSQSQQQILILSLFLTACVTQTWSAFAPILLDDPVTHFDDLNAYSFLDLIGGLAEAEQHRRQFILSTCDERLFLLARQRFQYLGDRIKMYRFVSCGREGPLIEPV